MNTDIVVALISAATAIGLAIWGLVTARYAKGRVLQAEYNAKRSEQIRLKAIEAGSLVMGALADYIIGVKTLLFYYETEVQVSEDLIAKTLAPVGEAVKKMRREVLKNAMYLTDDIVEDTERLASQSDFSKPQLETRLSDAQKLHSSLTSRFQDAYLAPIGL